MCTVAICNNHVNVNILLSTPHRLFRDNLQHWLAEFARLLKVQFTRTEGMSDDAPIHECESEIDHYTGHYVPTLYEECVGSLTSHRFITCARACETGPTVYRPYPRGLESLTICRCYYKGSTFSSVILKTLSVGPTGV